MYYHPETTQEFSSVFEIKNAFPYTSFGPLDNEEERNAAGFFTIEETPPIMNEIYGYAERSGVELVNGTYRRTWIETPWPPSKLRQNLTRAITEKRKQVETGGVTFPNGMTVSTGIDDQNRITSVIANADLSGVTSVDFKAESGWITLSLEQVKGIAIAIALHVQACFTAERNHHQNVDALTDEELASYDITTGWPNQ